MVHELVYELYMTFLILYFSNSKKPWLKTLIAKILLGSPCGVMNNVLDCEIIV